MITDSVCLVTWLQVTVKLALVGHARCQKSNRSHNIFKAKIRIFYCWELKVSWRCQIFDVITWSHPAAILSHTYPQAYLPKSCLMAFSRGTYRRYCFWGRPSNRKKDGSWRTDRQGKQRRQLEHNIWSRLSSWLWTSSLTHKSVPAQSLTILPGYTVLVTDNDILLTSHHSPWSNIVSSEHRLSRLTYRIFQFYSTAR
jgi:hypothetical protein